VVTLGGSENAIRQAFSSQVVTLGGSENAIRQAFSSQVASLGGSENVIKRAFGVSPVGECNREEIIRNTKITIDCISKYLINRMTIAPFTANNSHALVLLDFKYYLTIQ
jgi:hypothetical protein